MTDFPRRPSFIAEDIERRTDLRGPVKGLRCALPGGAWVDVLEAGRRGVFVGLDDPDVYALGSRLEVTLEIAAERAIGSGGPIAARVEVVRKEIDPRRGAALMIVHITPAAEAIYLGWLEVGG
jgi:hypothetical protein